MTLIAATPMLRTLDLGSSIRFYTDVLGFECTSIDREWGWASLRRDSLTLKLTSVGLPDALQLPVPPLVVHFSVDDIDAFWEALESKASICYPLFDFEPGTREFAIYDNNGHVLQFSQENASV